MGAAGPKPWGALVDALALGWQEAAPKAGLGIPEMRFASRGGWKGWGPVMCVSFLPWDLTRGWWAPSPCRAQGVLLDVSALQGNS